MRRLRTWLRSSMTMKRMGSIAIMNIHNDWPVDHEQAVKLFIELHPRKLNEKNLIFE